MEEQVVQFLESLAAENRSAHTLSAYRSDLFQFTRFAQEYSTSNECMIESWRAVDAHFLHHYVHFLAADLGYSAATIARKIASLRSFYAFLAQRGETDSNPTEEMITPRQSRNALRPLCAEDVTCLLNGGAETGRHYPLRDRALLELLCTTGLRQTEIVALNMSDIDWEAQRICCGAGRKRRWLALQPAALHALTRYVAEEHPHLKRAIEEQTLFLNHLGKPLSRQGVWLIVQRRVEQAGISAEVTPLTLRHTFALHQIEGGADIQMVRRRLGLVSLTSAQVYCQAAHQNAPELEIDGVAVGRVVLQT